MTVIQKAELEKFHEKHSQINKYVGLSTSASEISSAFLLIDGNKDISINRYLGNVWPEVKRDNKASITGQRMSSN